jgi:hypothetical protein
MAWYVGLGAAATLRGDALWNGEHPGDAMRARLTGVYGPNFADQNLVTGLPFWPRETAW